MISRDDVRRALVLSGLSSDVVKNKFQLVDRNWNLCSERFCLDNWRNWMAHLPEELKEVRNINGHDICVPRWFNDCFDCDNHCTGTLYHAQLTNAHTRATSGKKRGGILYGMLFYDAVPKEGNLRSGPHAINWFINYRRRLRFFESAEGRVIELTQEEIDSIWFGVAA